MFLLGLAVVLSLLSYSPLDPSWNTATGSARVHNWLGLFGAQWADFVLQIFGLSAFLLPLHVWALSWKWFRSAPVESPKIRIAGGLALWFSLSAACGLLPLPFLIGGTIRPSGMVGMVIADYLMARLNFAGALIAVAVVGVLALYLASTFEVSTLQRWLSGPIARWNAMRARWREARELKREAAIQRAKERAAQRANRRPAAAATPRLSEETEPVRRSPRGARRSVEPATAAEESSPAIRPTGDDGPPFDLEPEEQAEEEFEGIPIRALEQPMVTPSYAAAEVSEEEPQWEEAHPAEPVKKRKKVYRLPSSTLLNEAPPGNGYDSQELQEVATRIKSKLDEFNVRGSVVQINPGPVVTTFEYKPDAGVKYSRITTLTEDLCLGLQAESVLIERLPGKPTVGIEVPNTRREVISFRAILESGEFRDSASKMTIALGKDVNGRIKVAPLETMPHLLIAGSTGFGQERDVERDDHVVFV